MQIGVYKEDKLVEKREQIGLTSDILPAIVDELIKSGAKEFIYTSGPGSHMATKICYTLLKSVEVVTDLPFRAVSAFELNDNKPIKALGKLYFVKEKETIITKKFEQTVNNSFFMPDSLKHLTLLASNEPDYHIAAVS